MPYTVEKRDSGYAVLQEDGSMVDEGLSKKDAQKIADDLNNAPAATTIDSQPPASVTNVGDLALNEAMTQTVKGDGGEDKSEHNPHGLDIHERFTRLLKTLARHGIKHSETAHPSQNPLTADENYADPDKLAAQRAAIK